jgi:hypothetical protein
LDKLIVMIIGLGDLILFTVLWFVLAIVFGCLNESSFEDNSWREDMFEGVDNVRKLFGINLFYEIFKILLTILWICLYPLIFVIKFFVVGCDIFWLFKRVQ